MESDNANIDVFYKSKWGRQLVPPKYAEAVKSSEIMSCKQCGKEYRNSYSLWLHAKTCSTSTKALPNVKSEVSNNVKCEVSNNVKSDVSMSSNPDIVTKLIDQNKDLITKNMELTDKIIEPINNTTFNMNFYVNNNCKEPVNTGEFVNVVKPQLEKLDGIQPGHATSVSNIITSRLRDMEKPPKQQDAKRGVVYAKSDTSWIKKPVENL